MEVNISVVIPTYNREKTIERCINSINNQTIKPYEIIVVDDGSIDRTVEIVTTIDNTIRIIRQNHKGAQAARNLGIVNADGNYIAFLDSDDEWEANFIEEMLSYITDGNEDKVLYANCYIFDDNNGRKKLWRLPGCSGNIRKFLLENQGPMFQGMVVKKSIICSIGFLDENVTAYQEWETSLRLSENNLFLHIDKPLFIYHLHEGETISKDKRKGLKGYYYIVNKHRQEIIRELGYEGIRKHYEWLLHNSLPIRDKSELKYFFGFLFSLIKIKMQEKETRLCAYLKNKKS